MPKMSILGGKEYGNFSNLRRGVTICRVGVDISSVISVEGSTGNVSV